MSLGAGLIGGTFFLEILPQIVAGETYLGDFVYVAFLLGFVFVHVLEKLVYQRAAGEKEFTKDVTRFEAVGLAVYGLLVGVIIVVFLEAYGGLAYVVFAPFFFRAFVLSVSFRHLNEEIDSRLNRVWQFASPIAGAFIGLLLITGKTRLFLVFSMTMGFVLYIVIRDMIPIGKEGKPFYFIVGVLITIVTSLISQGT